MDTKPTATKYGKLTLLTYELPQRIYTAKVYPVKSANGSSIVVYGHQNGIQIAWRGGKPLKDNTPTKPPAQNSNGNNNDIVMVIDSDEEETPTTTQSTYSDKVEFETEEPELDPAEPHSPIIQHLDLALGTDVLDISFPHISDDPLQTAPRITSHHILMAVACADCTVRLLVLPLLPPSRPSKSREEFRKSITNAYAGQGRWGEQMLVIGGLSGHQKIPTGVALTFTPRHSSTIDEQSGKEAEKSSDEEEWDLLLASHSSEVNGVLHIYRLPIESQAAGSTTTYTIPAGNVAPFQSHYLSSPATTISFNPSIPAASRHSQLLVVESKGALRVYDCLPSAKMASRRSGRRISASSTGSNNPPSDRGSWLASFYPEFESMKSNTPMPSIPRRKTIRDARWALGGGVIVVLLSDGRWGIWDIEGVGPNSKKGLLNATAGSQGVEGGAVTSFAISGWIDNTPAKASSSRPLPASGNQPGSTLAPMTPGTRRIREEVLFSGPAPPSSTYGKGGISVLQFKDRTRGGFDDTSIILWHDRSAIAMKSLLHYWHAESKTGGILFGSGKDRIVKLDGLDLRGEMIANIDQFAAHDNADSTLASSVRGLQRDVLVAGEHRLLMLCPPLPEAPSLDFTKRIDPEPTRVPITFARDQQLLSRGELDLDGMDRMLASMENRPPQTGKEPLGKRKVGFLA